MNGKRLWSGIGSGFGKKLAPTDHPQRQEGAREALLCLSLINLLNFADRYVPSAVKELIKEDLDLTDTETALPTTVSFLPALDISSRSFHFVPLLQGNGYCVHGLICGLRIFKRYLQIR
jgi:hypothetical protein